MVHTLFVCRDAAKEEPSDAGGADAGVAAAAAAMAGAAAAAATLAAADAAGAVDALRGLPQHVPVQYDRLGRELQKWIQCNKCEKWRKVPYGLDDRDIPEEWQCKDNVWDAQYNSCAVQQQVRLGGGAGRAGQRGEGAAHAGAWMGAACAGVLPRALSLAGAWHKLQAGAARMRLSIIGGVLQVSCPSPCCALDLRCTPPHCCSTPTRR